MAGVPPLVTASVSGSQRALCLEKPRKSSRVGLIIHAFERPCAGKGPFENAPAPSPCVSAGGWEALCVRLRCSFVFVQAVDGEHGPGVGALRVFVSDSVACGF